MFLILFFFNYLLLQPIAKKKPTSWNANILHPTQLVMTTSKYYMISSFLHQLSWFVYTILSCNWIMFKTMHCSYSIAMCEMWISWTQELKNMKMQHLQNCSCGHLFLSFYKVQQNMHNAIILRPKLCMHCNTNIIFKTTLGWLFSLSLKNL